jgi:hypothetical protein
MHKLAIRAALGVGWARIARGLLIESLVLTGGAAGPGLGAGCQKRFSNLDSAHIIPPMKPSLTCAALVGMVAALVPASAHHSFAIFDHSRTYTLRGTVTAFLWQNPHGYIEMDVTDGPDGIEHFTLELTSINMLRRSGWRSTDVHYGDEVTAVTSPLLSGEPAGLLLEIELPGGRTLVPPVPAINSFRRTP